jgi:hypothetical protein
MHVPFVQGTTRHPGSLTGIVKTLNEAGVPTKGTNGGKRTAGSRWDVTVVRRILSDPWIAGFERDAVRHPSAKRRIAIEYRIRRDPVTGDPLRLKCGPTVSPADWYEVNEWLESRGRGRGLNRVTYLLTAMDLLYCECGTGMVGHSNDQPSKVSYLCKGPKPLATVGNHAGRRSILCRFVDDYVTRAVFARIAAAESDPETLELIAEATRRHGKRTESPERTAERREIVSARADSTRALGELYADREAGVYDNPVGVNQFRSAVKRHSESIAAADARLVELDDSDSPLLPIFEWMGEPGSDPIGEGSWWASASHHERRDFLKLFVDRITIRRAPLKAPIADRVAIVWASPPDEDDQD